MNIISFSNITKSLVFPEDRTKESPYTFLVAENVKGDLTL